MKSVYTFLAISGLVAALGSPKARGETPAPLPPLQTVLDRVEQTSATENADYHVFNQHYFYTRDRVTEFFDSAGKVKEKDESLSTNNPTRASAAKLHPVPQILSHGTQAISDGPSVHGVALGKKEDLLNPDIIKRFKFTLVGRDTINGRPTLIVDFKPVCSDLPIFNIKDRFINSAAGRAWVDEEDYQLEKVDIHLTQKITFLEGIVGSISKFTLSFVRDRTPDGYWFTRSMNWHLEAHEATIPRIVSHSEEVSSLQKMR